MIGGLTGLAVLGFGFWSSWQIARAKTQEDYEKKKQRRGRYDAAPKFEWDAFWGIFALGDLISLVAAMLAWLLWPLAWIIAAGAVVWWRVPSVPKTFKGMWAKFITHVTGDGTEAKGPQ